MTDETILPLPVTAAEEATSAPDATLDAAESARIAVARITESMDVLMEIFAHEEAAVRARDLDAMKAVTEQKAVIARGYEDSLRKFRLDTTIHAHLDAETKAALTAKAEAFQAALEQNAKLLKTEVDVSQNVVNAIVGAINHLRLQETGYGPARPGLRTGGSYRSTSGTSATLNQTL